MAILGVPVKFKSPVPVFSIVNVMAEEELLAKTDPKAYEPPLAIFVAPCTILISGEVSGAAVVAMPALVEDQSDDP